jgi:hypothetical protein
MNIMFYPWDRIHLKQFIFIQLIKKYPVGTEVFTVVGMKSSVFQVHAACFMMVSCLACSSTLNVEARY